MCLQSLIVLEQKSIYTELDLRRLSAERRRMTSFETDSHGYEKIAFHLDIHETELTRYFDPAPFVPVPGWQTGKNAAKKF